MSIEHIIIGQQSDWGAWVTPSNAVPVDSWSGDPGVSYQERRMTGRGRGLKYARLGSKLPSGSLEMPLWSRYMGYFIHAAVFNILNSNLEGTTTAYRHSFLPGADTLPAGLSVQVKYASDEATNWKGVVFDRLEITAQAGEAANLSLSWVAKDEARSGGSWDDAAGSAAPAVIATPAYFEDATEYLMFDQVALVLDPAFTWDDINKLYTFTGGSDLALIEMASVSINQNLDPKVFLGSRLAANNHAGDLDIDVRMDFDQEAIDPTFYQKMRAATRIGLIMSLTGGEIETGHNFKFEVILPSLYIPAAAYPDVSGGNDRRMQTVEARALVDENDNEINIQIVDDTASYTPA